MIHATLTLSLLIYGAPKSPQAVYEKYLAAFQNSPGISGATFSSMMGEPKSTIFRLLPGGRSITYKTNQIEYCDGKQSFLHSLDENKYTVGPPDATLYGSLFGARFAPPGFVLPKAIEYEEKTVSDRVEWALTIELPENSGRAVLRVRKATGMPTGIEFLGQQGNWPVTIQELHPNRMIRPETVFWAPPPGAQKAESNRE